MVPTAAGKRRHLVVHQQYSETKDLGQVKQTWSDAGTYWVQIIPVGGKEDAADEGMTAQITHRVRMLYTGTVKHRDRFLYRGRTLNVTSVVNVEEADVEYDIACEEQEV